MGRESVACVVVMPVGPGVRTAFLDDTIRSVFRHSRSRIKIVLADNTGARLERARLHRGDEIDLLPCITTAGARPLHGGLYYNLSKAFRHALERYDFAVLLRLDDDALVIGDGAEAEAIAAFAAAPRVGCLGSYRRTCTGAARDFAPAREALRSELSFAAAARHPRRWRLLRRWRAQARRHGYEDGEHCLGGAAFYSRDCLRALAAGGFLERRELLGSSLGEDHLFGLMVRAAGFENADFATAGRPLGLAWRGLPASPAELIGMGKKIVHSVKVWGELDQAAVRDEFRRLREGASARQARSPIR